MKNTKYLKNMQKTYNKNNKCTKILITKSIKLYTFSMCYVQ